MKKINFIKPLVVALLMFSSCNDELLDKVNPNELSTETFFRTRGQAEAAVNGIYAALQANQLYNREYFFVQDLLSDDVASGGGQLEAPRALVLRYEFDASNPLINAVWSGLYRVIHRANFVLSRIEDVPDTEITIEDRQRMEGEARFLRAWAYFDVVSLWGAAPLMTEPAEAIEGYPRSSEEEIYALVMEDLALAEQYLPLVSEYRGTANLGRASKGAAQALSARVHLFRGDYAAAKTQLQKVIDSNLYALFPDYIENFREEFENNVESIFEVQFTESVGTADAWNGDGRGIAEITFRGQEYGPNAWRNIVPNPDLRSAFPEGDPRYGYSFYEAGETYFGTDEDGNPNVLGNGGWKKYQMIYKRAQEDTQSGINFRVIRYADVLLMMAEAVNETETPANAIGYVNTVRARPSVNLPALDAPADKDAMFQLIMTERRLELAGEQIRNRDLRRWHKNGKINITDYLGSKFQAKHILLPIPTNELDRNPELGNTDQNPGY